MIAPEYIIPLAEALRSSGNPENAAPMETYMKGLFPFLGIKQPDRKALQKDFFKAAGKPTPEELVASVNWLWAQPEREFQYVAIDLLDRYGKKWNPGPSGLFFFEKLITEKSWWDTVDMLAQKMVARFFQFHPEMIRDAVEKWLASGNLWLQRTAILFQNRYKTETDEALLFELCERLAGSEEFFLRKAIGWALRDYSKTHPEAVQRFVETHENKLSGLAKREALRRIKNKA